jgi:branched-chain amino acid transport system ATP-binding protein
MLLEINDLAVSYNQLRAVRGISLRVHEGAVVALIGSNGAGKTTVLNAISGLVPKEKGVVNWRGRAVAHLPADEICRLGIVQVPEGRKLFAGMTVEENLQIGAYVPHARDKYAQTKIKVFGMFPILEERRQQKAGSLSGGEQQMLALGRALMALPELLMLDEPCLGLAPVAAAEIFQAISDLNSDGMTILLVSQELIQTLSIAGSCYLLENGKITLEGTGAQLLADTRVKDSYLGM